MNNMKLRKDSSVVTGNVLFVVMVYLIVASTWILFSDRLLYAVVSDRALGEQLSVVKGLLFVVVTGIMLYGMISRLTRRLADIVREKDMLLQELNHRVNNTLQLISNLTSLQRRYIAGRDTAEVLDDVRNRVRSIAVVYEKLYLAKGLSNIRPKEYISELIDGIFGSYGGHKHGIDLKLHIADVRLDLDQAIAMGLIINEVVTNAFKYAFTEATGGEITVSLDRVDDGLELIIGDNGIGLPVDFDPEKTSSLGMRLIFGLARKQLDANIELDRSSGTVYRIFFRRQDAG